MPIGKIPLLASVFLAIHHPELVNIYGATIGKGTKIASFVEIGEGVVIGKNCKIEAFCCIPKGVT